MVAERIESTTRTHLFLFALGTSITSLPSGPVTCSKAYVQLVFIQDIIYTSRAIAPINFRPTQPSPPHPPSPQLQSPPPSSSSVQTSPVARFDPRLARPLVADYLARGPSVRLCCRRRVVRVVGCQRTRVWDGRLGGRVVALCFGRRGMCREGKGKGRRGGRRERLRGRRR